jgi:hypothetical protein
MAKRTGRGMTPDGYVRVRAPKHPLCGSWPYILEHRLVWYEAHGPIPPGMVVHHINGIRHDNRLENLQLLTLGEHSRHHKAEYDEARRGPIVTRGETCPQGHDDWSVSKRQDGRTWITCRLCKQRRDRKAAIRDGRTMPQPFDADLVAEIEAERQAEPT